MNAAIFVYTIALILVCFAAGVPTLLNVGGAGVAGYLFGGHAVGAGVVIEANAENLFSASVVYAQIPSVAAMFAVDFNKLLKSAAVGVGDADEFTCTHCVAVICDELADFERYAFN